MEPPRAQGEELGDGAWGKYSRHKGDGEWGSQGGGHKEPWHGKTSGGSSGSRSSPYTKKGQKGGGGHHQERIRRGGWFARCQLLCSTVLAHNWGTARELADEFDAGPDKFD